MDYSELIGNALRELEDPKIGFRPGELAYLALTSKPELAIRDRLAFQLHEKLKQNGFSVSREYSLEDHKRADIAVLPGKDSKRPAIGLIELKVSSFFNLDNEAHPKKPGKIVEEIKSDFNKWSNFDSGKPEVFCLFLAPNIETDRLPEGFLYEELVVSWSGWSGYRKKRRRDKASVKKDIEILFKNKWDLIAHDEMEGGSAFGLEVSVPYWLLKLPAQGRS